MGLGGVIGVIRPGAYADILLVDGDPLKDVTIMADKDRLLAIMQSGRFHKATNTAKTAYRHAAE
jgi:imidazolonepropionase-like amidohydrolase